MNEIPQFRCGDTDALVTYVYDECLPGERLAIDAHVLTCASCTEEIVTLRGTRAQLAEWTPPEVNLGFRITSAPADVSPAPVLRPAKWWSRPLPAWAQVAAAAAIFAAGLTLGAMRQGSVPSSVAQPASTQTKDVAFISPSTVSREDLNSLEQRLRGEIAQVQESAAPRATLVSTSAARGNDELLAKVRELIADSERRQQQAAVTRTAQMASQLEERHRADLVQVQQAVGQIEDLTGVTIRNQDQIGRYLGAPDTTRRFGRVGIVPVSQQQR
jgi:hypothetical protein